MLPGIAGRGERPTTLTSAFASKRVRFTRFRLLLTAKLTAKPADGGGRPYTVTARVLELDRGGEHRRTSLDAPDVHDAQGVGGSNPSRPTTVTSAFA